VGHELAAVQAEHNALTGEIILRASIHADTAAALASVIDQVTDPPPSHHLHSRTCNGHTGNGHTGNGHTGNGHTGNGHTGNGRPRQTRPAGEADASPASDDLCDAPRAPGSVPTASQTVGDQQRCKELMIEQRFVLSRDR
jgi:hypothetical protein